MPPRADRLCGECGGNVDEEPAPAGSQFLDSPERESVGEDELVRAFIDQFERRRLRPPVSWIDRMRRLAVSVEPCNRLATIVFVDLREYSRLTRKLDPERLMEFRHQFDELCLEELEAHRGFLIQFLGDGAFGAFGAPWGFDRDAEAAANYLLAVRRRVREWGQFDGHLLAIRGGAATGIVRVGLKEEQGRVRPDIAGEAVNFAARLQNHGEAWDLLVSEATAELLAAQFQLEIRGSFEPKHFDRAETPRAIVGIRSSPLPRRRMDIPFVGRTAELATLGQDIEHARTGGFALRRVEGDAGAGKTRLIHEALRRASPERAERRFELALDPHDEHRLLAPFLEMLRSAAGGNAREAAGPADPEVVIGALYDSIPGLDPAWRGTLGCLAGVPENIAQFRGMGNGALERQAVEATVHFATRLCAAHPTTLVVDDMQWCDQLSRKAFGRLAELRPAGLCVFLAGRTDAENERSEFATSAAESRDSFESSGETLLLEPLGRNEMLALLGSLLDTCRLHPGTREGLLQAAGGNPHILIEQVRAFDANSATFPATLPATASLGELLQARAHRLPLARQKVLHRAAVLGMKFRDARLARFAAESPNVHEEIEALVAGDILVRDGDLLAFSSGLLREVVRDRLASEVRRRLHGEAAAMLESERAGSDDIVDLAFHWIESDRPERAMPLLRRAVAAALDLGNCAQAYDLAARAMKVLPCGSSARPQQRAILLELGGRAARSMGRFDAALDHLEEWKRLGETTGNPVWTTNARAETAKTWMDLGRAAEGHEELVRILAEGGAGSEGRPGNLRLWLGESLYLLHRHEEAIAVLRPICEDAEAVASPQPVHGEAWNKAGLALWHLDRLGEAEIAYEKAASACLAMGRVLGHARALNNCGIVLEKMGRLEDACASLERALSVAEEKGYIQLVSAAESNLGNIALLRREWGLARSRGERALHFGRMVRHGYSETIGLLVLALAAEGSGEIDEARMRAAEAVRIARERPVPFALPGALAEAAWIGASAGDEAGARALLDELPENPGGEAARLRDTTLAALASLATGCTDGLLAPEAIASPEANLDFASRLRRIDTALFLARRGVAGAERNVLEGLRERVLRASACVRGSQGADGPPSNR